MDAMTGGMSNQALAGLAMAGVAVGAYIFMTRKASPQQKDSVKAAVAAPAAAARPVAPAGNRSFTLDELAKYKGENGEGAIYVALKGVVYDVSSKPHFYGPEGGYHCFAGRDAARALATMKLDEEASNIDDLDQDQLKVLQDWVDRFSQQYPVVGKIGAPLPLMSPEELAKFKGQDGSPIYVAIKGKVYDVSAKPEHYGPDGGYHSFAGRDASRALATMQVHEMASNIDDLTEQQQKTLQDWIARFESQYPVVANF